MCSHPLLFSNHHADCRLILLFLFTLCFQFFFLLLGILSGFGNLVEELCFFFGVLIMSHTDSIWSLFRLINDFFYQLLLADHWCLFFLTLSWHILMRMRTPKQGSCEPIAPLELPHSLHAFHRVSESDELNKARHFTIHYFAISYYIHPVYDNWVTYFAISGI